MRKRCLTTRLDHRKSSPSKKVTSSEYLKGLITIGGMVLSMEQMASFPPSTSAFLLMMMLISLMAKETFPSPVSYHRLLRFPPVERTDRRTFMCLQGSQRERALSEGGIVFLRQHLILRALQERAPRRLFRERLRLKRHQYQRRHLQ